MFDYEGSRSEFLKILAELGKECAFGRDTADEEFKSLPLLDSAYLLERFPLLLLPALT
jgi:hypothetical protein